MYLKKSLMNDIAIRTKNILIALLIASLFFCVTCSSYEKFEKAGYSFCVLLSDSSANISSGVTTPVQTIGATYTFHFDLASEETLGRLSSSYSTISMISRSMTNQQRSLALFQLMILISTLLFGSLNRLRASAYENYDRHEDNSLCITRYIEISDGKK